MFGSRRTRTYASSRKASQTHPRSTAVQSVPLGAEIPSILGVFPKSNILQIRPSGTDFKRKPGVERVSPMLNTPQAVGHSPPVVAFRRQPCFGPKSCLSAVADPPKKGLFQIRVKNRVSGKSILHSCHTPPSFFFRRRPGTSRFSPISFQ